jgi:hypothetical protein
VQTSERGACYGEFTLAAAAAATVNGQLCLAGILRVRVASGAHGPVAWAEIASVSGELAVTERSSLEVCLPPGALMNPSRPNRRTYPLSRTCSLALLVLAGVPAGSALAHFVLMSPDSWSTQSAQGDPQKTRPCGAEPGAGIGMVTSFAPGDSVTIGIDETIYHPGHYRVSLAVNDRNELPPDPVVSPGASACESAAIQSPPVFPVLADGMLAHTTRFETPQTFSVKLPTDVSCTRCTLQVVEFMSAHGAPCFYYHCAEISILPGGVGTTDAGVQGGGGAPRAGASSAQAGGMSQAGTDMSDGCAVSRAGATIASALGELALLGLVARSVRRRANRSQ